MNEMMTTFSNAFAAASLTQWLVFLPLFLAVYFLPALLALAFNRKHLKLILIANIPAGFSMIAWGALIVWAVTGKMMEKKQPEKSPV
ncbi:superinfection immunity protein [Rheinheimera sp. 1928-s]|uniref:superinfection immunity protein n=1 Tax=Rheinheimera sp. 1928-s TaxID=3033803 RepID=UPI002606206B|nr:superinfection immunity protein [Rheinheimera sp. 1928-s]MDF3126750.1 superinfection immunity protein [Rheinheimera sp. 1928-s]